jgi:glucose/arabinose dehydrogenase
VLVVVTGLAGGAACSAAPGAPSATSPPSSRQTSAPSTTVPSPSSSASTRPAIALTKVADVGEPVATAARGSDLYVADQSGLVVALRGGSGPPETVLDITNLTDSSGEQGLLGIAISPDDGFVYLDYTDLNGDTNVDELALTPRGVDASTRRRVLFMKQPFPNHNGGQLAFGPDGYLYIGLGDGGSGGDPQDNGQSLDTLLGKILRIDPQPGEGSPYTIPGDNPFVGHAGARPEIWAYGLRNPWRFSFDTETGDLWIADVGQGEWEEIDHQPADSPGGENYGWSRLEGTHLFSSLGGSGRPAGAVDPVYEYDHSGGRCTVIGGYVYRGQAIPGLQGTYLFTDFCGGLIIGLPTSSGKAFLLDAGPTSISSFGEDSAGELYVLVLGVGVYRIDAA